MEEGSDGEEVDVKAALAAMMARLSAKPKEENKSPRSKSPRGKSPRSNISQVKKKGTYPY